MKGGPRSFNYVSTTFVFGWAVKKVLYETDFNGDMELLDFGYSQSKWVAEQVVMDARRHGTADANFPARSGESFGYRRRQQL